MPATARLIVMMEPEAKAALEAQASAARLSTAEFVRRRLAGRADAGEQAFLELLAELRPLVDKATGTLATNLAEIRALRTGSDSPPRGRTRAGTGLTRGELTAIADRLRLSPSRRRRGRT